MNKDRLRVLLKKNDEGNCTEDEYMELDNWFHEINYNEVNFGEWLSSGGGEEVVKKRLFSEFNQTYMRKSGTIWLRSFYKMVAVLVLICCSFLIYTYYNTRSNVNYLSEKEDVAPGGNKAILTLSNGERVSLNDSKTTAIATQNGVKISKTADGQLIYQVTGDTELASKTIKYNTIETPKGGQYRVVLPDSSRVWLNAFSSLTFPTTFANQTERRVTLSGEAYFEVSKKATHIPFIVLSRGQELEVLGTHFNIEAYKDGKNIKTTLLEGSVRLSLLNKQGFNNLKDKSITLSPGDQSTLHINKDLSVNKVDVNDAIAWKNDYFMFKNEPLESIMQKVSNWYNVEVVFKNEELRNDLFWGTVSRSKNVSSILKVLEMTGEVQFRVEGNKIIVMK
ncbi:MAG: FecR family protein [Candidatus Pedobacter colombiensis]|uniref:FecR family protein n=1 Tax=Candidatus Pedobacter colombiensis TaxID=3121371 RepID=A0AAJ6B7Z2_9SPHI|nr:FecR family protein [Pedobacter sp.]WEK21632.1 MAG: FecR family protein [Pedobacter sp.]